MKSARFQKAQRRLTRDLQELADRSWELPTVSALPLEDNILEWHCNIVGVGEHDGITLHLKMLFPVTYPHQPPEVVLMSEVCHPNVFGDHLCMDMLEEGQWADTQERDAEFTGWSTCYSVFSILMQLQAFLFDEGSDPEKTRWAARRCQCFCGHGHDRVYPPLPEPMEPPVRPVAKADPFAEDDAVSSTKPSSDDEEVSGTVTRVERYGAFVNLDGGNTGLLRWANVPRGLRLEPGRRITCRHLSSEPPMRLELTMKRSTAELEALADSRARFPATVASVQPYGAFLDLGGVQALLHRSQTDLLTTQRIPWEIGETVNVRLIGLLAPKAAVSSKALYLRPSKPRELVDGDVDLGRMCCFHSKAGILDSVLGVGVALEAEELPNGQQRHHLTSIYDLLAQESFQDGVRKGVWKQKFSEFLPLAVDAEHFSRAQRYLEDSVSRMASGVIAEKTRSHGKSRADKEAEYKARVSFEDFKRLGTAAIQKAAPPSMGRAADAPFTPNMILDIIPKLMNSQVVLLSTGQLWRCEKALEGYFAYHHLLLHCLKAYPSLHRSVEATIKAFVENPSMRSKEHVPNMGEFLCLLSVSDAFGWEELGIAILEEVFDRNVLWILKQFPQLGDLSDNLVSQARLRKSFKANIISLRLLMFQVAFLQLARPAHKHAVGGATCCSASCMLEMKDRCKGLPGPGQAEWLFRRCVDILSVEDFTEFLELVGASPMDDAEVCRWLRQSMLRSVGKNYHNPRYFENLVWQKQGEKEAKKSQADMDPDDFGMDNRPKTSKAEKKAKRAALAMMQAAALESSAEFRRALNWARAHPPRWNHQSCVFIDSKSGITALEDAIDKKTGELTSYFEQARRGFKLLNSVQLAKVMSFPAFIWLGLGCIDCSKLVTCESSGRCMSCCKHLARDPKNAKPIKGLTSPDASVAQFAMFQAEAVKPVQWEVHLEVKFDGLVADLSPLRAVLGDDLTVMQPLDGAGRVFSRVSRAGRKLWESSPEQVIFPGAKLVSGWKGVTDAIFKTTIRGRSFTLLEDTMHDMTELAEIEQLRMTRTWCHDHVLKDEKTKEVIWNRPCKNCRGLLRLRFAAPQRFAERKAQLESLEPRQLAQRAQLCGLQNECRDAVAKKELITTIIKSEGIIR